MNRRAHLHQITAGLTSLGLAGINPILRADETYPNQPIKIIVPFPPGGVADQVGRPLSIALERAMKARLLIENRPGAGGGVGMAAAARAKPDGYTVLMALSSITVIPAADKLNARKPQYELSELAPIALITADPTLLCVSADSPWATSKDLIADAKRRPGAISYGSSGVYGTLHVAMEMLSAAADIQLQHVPFQGAGPAVTALLGGHVQLLASGPSAVISQVKAGKLRVLASWGDRRLAAMPEVATLKELGWDAEFYIWSGVFVPAAVPDAVKLRLRQAVQAAVQDPQFKQALDTMASPLAYLDAPEFASFVEKDAAKMARVVQRIGKE